MTYIGNTSADRFVAAKAATQFSGDGSTVAFTLEHSVGSDEDILVSVDGVIQEPSVAYSVSGTTLSFTAAPSNNSGNNIFVYYLFRTVGTVSHPSNNALSATSGTFSGAITGGGTFTPGGNIVIPDAGNIGSASDTDAISISSGGVVTLSQSSQNAQTFRLDHDVSGTANLQMFTDFEEADTDYTRVGSANWTVSSGAFSCATTGTYLCLYGISLTAASGGDEFDFNIEISTNSGASFSVRSRTMCFVTGGQKSSVSNAFIFTVSDTSPFRLRMTAGNSNNIASGSTVLGSSNNHQTGLTFVKLGVI